jgi:hypothetical protein
VTSAPNAQSGIEIPCILPIIPEARITQFFTAINALSCEFIPPTVAMTF